MFRPVKCPDNCVYLMTVNGEEPMCGFLLQTDTMRGCDPGPGCTRYVGKIKKRRGCKSKRLTWDADRGRQLWEQGYTDTRIAKEVGTSTGNITSYRRRKWGARNKGPGPAR